MISDHLETQRVRYLTFFSTRAYFVKGNTKLMTDLTDN